MKVLLLSTSDIEGGAARAAYRLHQGLELFNVDSNILVRTKSSDDLKVIAPQNKIKEQFAHLRTTLDNLPLRLYSKRQSEVYSLEWFPDAIIPKVADVNPDIINLHWVCYGFLKIETISKFNKPLVWTLHDMWAFTGGCHYSLECDRYMNSCGSCPQLQSNKEADLSRWVWQRKTQAWQNLNLTLVTPSLWLAKCANNSSLFKNFRVEVIPNGIDIERYKPIDREVARKVLNLPLDKQLIVFGAMNATSDRRKGFHLLQPALQNLSQSGWQDKIELIIIGASRSSQSTDLGFKTRYLGKLSDDISLALIYAAADVFVAPSIQDNLPNTVMEAIACGTPSVAFNIGGMPDMIEHQKNGYLAKPYQIEDLAKGIVWVLENQERHQKLCDRAREKVTQEFTQQLQAQRYLSLFNELVASDRSRQQISARR